MSRTPPTAPPDEFAHLFTAEYLARRRQLVAAHNPSWEGVDDTSPKSPTGHARALEVSTRLTTQFRTQYRTHAMDITPQDVIDVIVAADVKDWVLMGLHGYAGYMPEPRATQDVDIMVPKRQHKRARNAIQQAWPTLKVRELSEVIRFMDPGDLDADGEPKPVIDLMLPLATFQQMILKEFVIIEPVTKHRIPRLEASLVAKYAPMVSLGRNQRKKNLDASDFRSLVCANYDTIDRDSLHRLADEVFPGAGDEILGFVELAMNDKPFPL